MQTTVLFADLSGSSKLHELAGEAVALEIIARCMERLRQAAEAGGGEVVKTSGDQVMALFPTPDAAASAATIMHATIDALPPVRGTRLGVHVGFHSGPVMQRDHDVAGETVKLASRLLEEAQKGQTVTSRETAAKLGPAFRAISRGQPIALHGAEATLRLCEVVTHSAAPRAAREAKPGAAAEVRLTYHGEVIACSAQNETVVIGRHRGCGLVVADRMASRRHCTIELRGEEYVLQDHSMNGTYVTVAGEKGILLRGEDLPLAKQGSIAFGHKHFEDSEEIHFACVVA